jgi:hypothetical protein
MYWQILVAVVILNHQDRMLAAGHPLASEHGITNLYNQVISADEQLKDTYHAMPAFLKDDSVLNNRDASCPDHMKFQGSITFLSYAHKVSAISDPPWCAGLQNITDTHNPSPLPSRVLPRLSFLFYTSEYRPFS